MVGFVVNHEVRNWAKRTWRGKIEREGGGERGEIILAGYANARRVTLTLKKNKCEKEHHWFTKRASRGSGTCCSLYRNALAVKGLRDDLPLLSEQKVAAWRGKLQYIFKREREIERGGGEGRRNSSPCSTSFINMHSCSINWWGI